MRVSERASCSNLSYRVATLSPHPEEHRAAMRLEGWQPALSLPTTARGLPRAIETALRASSG